MICHNIIGGRGESAGVWDTPKGERLPVILNIFHKIISETNNGLSCFVLCYGVQHVSIFSQ
jgi:hypothetical protein